MIVLSGMISIPYLKKSAFTGSYQGMRYLLKKTERPLELSEEGATEQTKTCLTAIIWPEPYGYDATPKEKMHEKDFTFASHGILDAVEWLNQEFEAHHF